MLWPTVSAAVAGLTRILATMGGGGVKTGCATISEAEALTPPAVAMIDDPPLETARTKPAEETVATAELELVHARAAPATVRPVESSAVPLNGVLAPTVSVAVAGEMRMLAIRACGVTGFGVGAGNVGAVILGDGLTALVSMCATESTGT